MRRWAIAFLIFSLLPGRVKGLGVDRPVPAILDPCRTPATGDTSGWQTIRFNDGQDGRRFIFQLPPSFLKDPAVRFGHGGTAWRDGRRLLVQFGSGGSACSPLRPDDNCSECQDSVGTAVFTFLSRYSDAESLFYAIAAVREYGDIEMYGHSRPELRGTSPDSSDQRLFLRIVRTLREDVRTTARGRLFMGGNRIDPPFVINSVRGRLVINGHALPDVVPTPARPPDPSGMLEARSAFEAALLATCDSLLRAGKNQDEVARELLTRAQAIPLVKDVDRPDSPPVLVRVVWPSGYPFFGITRAGRPLRWAGGGTPCYEENEKMVSDRLDHVHELLDGGGVLFLLGGGSEYAVDQAQAAPVLDSIRGLLAGARLDEAQLRLLPPDVRGQLLAPLRLDRAE